MLFSKKNLLISFAGLFFVFSGFNVFATELKDKMTYDEMETAFVNGKLTFKQEKAFFRSDEVKKKYLTFEQLRKMPVEELLNYWENLSHTQRHMQFRYSGAGSIGRLIDYYKKENNSKMLKEMADF